MGIKVNLTDVQSSSFEALPAGNYLVAVTDGEIRESGENAKNPGSEYINWELTVQEGEFEGRKLWTNTSLLPQALFAIKGLLEASGRFTPEQLAGDLDFEIEDLIGARVVVVVKQREYNGDMTNDVKRFKKEGDAKTGAAGKTASLLP